MRDSRQFIRDLSTIRPKILFRLPKGSGLILPPMNIARNTLWKAASGNWSQCWYAILTSKNENLMVQFIGNRWVRSYDLRFGKEEEILFLILIRPIIFGTQQNTISMLQERLRRSI